LGLPTKAARTRLGAISLSIASHLPMTVTSNSSTPVRLPAASVGLDVGGPDHLAPFLGFVGDQPAKVGGREREHVATQVGKPRLDLGVGEAGIDFLVEPVDDLGGRGLRCADAGSTIASWRMTPTIGAASICSAVKPQHRDVSSILCSTARATCRCFRSWFGPADPRGSACRNQRCRIAAPFLGRCTSRCDSGRRAR
jgi:hypothetical protein